MKPRKTFRVEFTADTDGNWCSQCASRTYDTQEEAEAAIAADETARPDPYGNVCHTEIVEVGK